MHDDTRRLVQGFGVLAALQAARLSPPSTQKRLVFGGAGLPVPLGHALRLGLVDDDVGAEHLRSGEGAVVEVKVEAEGATSGEDDVTGKIWIEKTGNQCNAKVKNINFSLISKVINHQYRN